jgi:hypothetical protein
MFAREKCTTKNKEGNHAAETNDTKATTDSYYETFNLGLGHGE